MDRRLKPNRYMRQKAENHYFFIFVAERCVNILNVQWMKMRHKKVIPPAALRPGLNSDGHSLNLMSQIDTV